MLLSQPNFHYLEFTMNAQTIKSAATTAAAAAAKLTVAVGTIALGVAAGGLLLAKLTKKD